MEDSTLITIHSILLYMGACGKSLRGDSGRSLCTKKAAEFECHAICPTHQPKSSLIRRLEISPHSSFDAFFLTPTILEVLITDVLNLDVLAYFGLPIVFPRKSRC